MSKQSITFRFDCPYIIPCDVASGEDSGGECVCRYRIRQALKEWTQAEREKISEKLRESAGESEKCSGKSS